MLEWGSSRFTKIIYKKILGKSQKTVGYPKLISYIKIKIDMGRMKEKFLDEQQRRDAEMQNQYLDDDYCCGQQCGCHEENEANANAADYDAWWNSLTNDQK